MRKKFCFSCLYNYDISLSSSRRKVSNANTTVDLIGTEDPLLNSKIFISVVITTVLFDAIGLTVFLREANGKKQPGLVAAKLFLRQHFSYSHLSFFFVIDFRDAGRDEQAGVCELSFVCSCVCRWKEITKYIVFQHLSLSTR